MEQTTRTSNRIYCIQLKGGGQARPDAWPDVMRIRAYCMTKHSFSHYTFQRENRDVGEVLESVAAWWIEEEMHI